MKRKSTGKSLRFDIFNRDGFTCQYCGQKPPAVVLELDHILAVSRGGDNSEVNLVTSCADCNRGKSAKVLGDVKPTPDADVLYLKAAQESAEIERFMAESKRREKAITGVTKHLQQVWAGCFGGEYVPTEPQIRKWISRYPPDIVKRGIEAAMPAVSSHRIGEWNFSEMLKYTSAIMRNLNEEATR